VGQRRAALERLMAGGDGRVVLVTGGTRGIGRACVERFVALGDRVVSTSRSGPDKEESDTLWSLPCDQRSTGEVDALFGRIEERWGPVQVLVANAGMNRDQLILRMGEEAWTDVVDTNLTGTYRVVKRAVGPMVRARQGRIVLVSSVSGLAGQAGQANYAASKAGLVGLARSLARELASRSILVNVVAPGPVETDMLIRDTIEYNDETREQIPLRRFGQPDEIARVIEFVAGPGGDFMVGQVLSPNGGTAI
jgi:3-oxoacyl-[acyl-carrier protein] reductase